MEYEESSGNTAQKSGNKGSCCLYRRQLAVFSSTALPQKVTVLISTASFLHAPPTVRTMNANACFFHDMALNCCIRSPISFRIPTSFYTLATGCKTHRVAQKLRFKTGNFRVLSKQCVRQQRQLNDWRKPESFVSPKAAPSDSDFDLKTRFNLIPICNIQNWNIFPPNERTQLNKPFCTYISECTTQITWVSFKPAKRSIKTSCFFCAKRGTVAPC